jgi:deferrochelatase/peroxidase EfeB
VSAHETPEQDVQPGEGSRRSFLTGAGAAALAGLTTAACAGSETAEQTTARAVETPTALPSQSVEPAEVRPTPQQPVAFAGPHQTGVLLAPAAAGLVASFDVIATDRAELIATLQTLSIEVERLMSDMALMQSDEFLPPVDSGAIGAETGTAGVAITMAVGASLFDDRFALAQQRPRELIVMPRFFNDRQVRDDLSHGDLSLTISAPNQQAAIFALHQAVRVTERRLKLRWVQEGYNQLLPERPGQLAHTRNLMGFRDGTSNLDTLDSQQMSEHVWVHADDDEPSWAVGGTYQATRIVRMLIEFWATAALVRQEQIFGRHRESGAPIGQTGEGDEPTFVSNPSDESIPRRSHMRLANPRTPGTGRILRRGFSYLNGSDVNGTLDQGLLFLCYQRSLAGGFLEVQSRLDGEPLEDYIRPVGGGFFFVLPGPGDSGGWLGESLFEA